MRDPRHGQKFAQLLESDLQLAARNHGADALASTDKMALALRLFGNSQALIELRGDIFPLTLAE